MTTSLLVSIDTCSSCSIAAAGLHMSQDHHQLSVYQMNRMIILLSAYTAFFGDFNDDDGV